jgi:hypothetical protein
LDALVGGAIGARGCGGVFGVLWSGSGLPRRFAPRNDGTEIVSGGWRGWRRLLALPLGLEGAKKKKAAGLPRRLSLF